MTTLTHAEKQQQTLFYSTKCWGVEARTVHHADWSTGELMTEKEARAEFEESVSGLFTSTIRLVQYSRYMAEEALVVFKVHEYKEGM